MTQKTKHTPTPWVLVGECIFDDSNGEIASTYDSNFSYYTDLANAAHIVKCVNLHEELVGALNKAQDCIRFGDRVSEADRIISEALEKAGAL